MPISAAPRFIEYQRLDRTSHTFRHYDPRAYRTTVSGQNDTVVLDLHDMDPFAANAPKLSDVEATLKFDVTRSTYREMAKYRANEFHRRIFNATPEELAAPHPPAESRRRFSGSEEYMDPLDHDEQPALRRWSKSPRELKVAERAAEFRRAAREYPTVAAYGRAAREEHDDDLHRAFGSEGKVRYHSICEASDLGMSRYLHALGNLYQPGMSEPQSPWEDHVEHASRRLLGSTVREWAMVMPAHNAVLSGEDDFADSASTERPGSPPPARLRTWQDFLHSPTAEPNTGGLFTLNNLLRDGGVEQYAAGAGPSTSRRHPSATGSAVGSSPG